MAARLATGPPRPGAEHAFEILPSVRTHHTVHAVERFLAIVRSQRGVARPADAVRDRQRA